MIRPQDHHQGPASSTEPDGVSLNGPGTLRLRDHRMLTDGQYGLCMAACDRAQEFLASSNGLTPESLAYWVHEGALDSQRSLLLCLLDKPHDAIEAARTAQARFDCSYVGGYAHCQIRLGHALVLSKEITEATRVLGNAAHYASLSPRLTQELHTTRALLQPWKQHRAVTALDAQLHACGLLLPPHRL